MMIDPVQYQLKTRNVEKIETIYLWVCLMRELLLFAISKSRTLLYCWASIFIANYWKQNSFEISE